MLLVPLRRVSSGEQVDGSGLQRQSDQAAAYAKANGWTLHPETYSDEGVSGFSGANLDGDLGRFLSDLKRGHFGTQKVALGIEDIDRLSRQFTLSFLPVLVDDFLNSGVTIAVMGKGRNISRESVKANPMEIHELLFWMGGAHEFSEKLSKRITDHRDRLRQQIRDGKPANPGKAPSWISFKKGKWELNEFADVIRRIIRMSQSGIGAPTICQRLNAEKVPSPGTYLKRRTNPRAKPGKWAPTVVLQILKQPALHGARVVAAPGHNAKLREWKESCAHQTRQGVQPADLPPKPERLLEPDQEGYYPPLLSKPEHDALLQSLTDRLTKHAKGRSDKMIWIGSRLTRCVCGERITTYSTLPRRGPGLYRYLRCTGKKHGTSNCQQKLVSLDSAESHLLARLSEANFVEMLRGQTNQNNSSKLQALIEQRTAQQKEISTRAAAISAGEKVMADADDPAVLSVLAKRQVSLEQQLNESQGALDATELQLQELQATGSQEKAALDSQQVIQELRQRFLDGTDDVADRTTVNHHLKRLGLSIVVGDGRMGLGIGDHESEWMDFDHQSMAKIVMSLGGSGMKAGPGGTVQFEMPGELTDDDVCPTTDGDFEE